MTRSGAFPSPLGKLIPLFDDFTDAGDVLGGPTNVYAHTLAAGQLKNNGDALHIDIGGVSTFAATAVKIKYYFGGTLIFDSGWLDSANVFANPGTWRLRIMIIRDSSTSIRSIGDLESSFLRSETQQADAAYGNIDEATVSYYVGVTGLTLTGTQALKATIESFDGGNAEITAKLGKIWYVPAKT